MVVVVNTMEGWIDEGWDRQENECIGISVISNLPADGNGQSVVMNPFTHTPSTKVGSSVSPSDPGTKPVYSMRSLGDKSYKKGERVII